MRTQSMSLSGGPLSEDTRIVWILRLYIPTISNRYYVSFPLGFRKLCDPNMERLDTAQIYDRVLR